LTYKILVGNVLDRLREMPDESVHCVVTSPPYWGLRDYGTAEWIGGDASCDHLMIRGAQGNTGQRAGRTHTQRVPYRDVCGRCGSVREDQQVGLEKTPEEFIARLVSIFREVSRVLRHDGTCWVNMGDSYANYGSGGNGATGGRDKSTLTTQMPPIGTTPTKKNMPVDMKPKDLCGMPWMLAFALRADGWYLRQDIIWSKPNPMPESVTDRCTKAHEYIFLLTKRATYFYDAEAIKEPASGTAHSRGDNLNPKAKEHGQNSRFNQSRNHAHVTRPKQNSSYSATINELLGVRNKRDVWEIATESFTGWTETSRRVRVSADAVTCDTEHIVSPDCPVHGDSFASASSAFCDEHAAGPLNHIPRTDCHPVPAPQCGYAPTAPIRDAGSRPGSSDSLDQLYFAPATFHSSQTHKTDPGPSTNQPCIASVQIPSGTQRSAEERSPCDLAGRKIASRSEVDCVTDAPGLDPLEQTRQRSEDICACDYYNVITEKISHFATFPTKLVEPCILAGTSEKGCCRLCGAPWIRVMESYDTGRTQKMADGWDTGAGGHGTVHREGRQAGQAGQAVMGHRHAGWDATCECDAEVVPCTVLDPFSGSGTTGVVSLRNHRDYIGVELNPEYAEMSRRRIQRDNPMFNVEVA